MCSPGCKPKLSNATKKTILLYTTLFGERSWYDLTEGSKRQHAFFDEFNCKFKNCRISYDRSEITKAHLVLFHGRDIEYNNVKHYSPDRLKLLRQSSSPIEQKWVFLSHENPWDSDFYVKYDGLFNWTAMYTLNSDIVTPYGRYEAIKSNTAANESLVENHAMGKKKLVSWAVSHCESIRERYALQLQKYLDLTVYGQCNFKFNNKGNCAQHEKACSQEMANYKFYLAFENDLCQDYVTEKYWKEIFLGVVPVVMGGNYNDKLVIPGSYIDVSDFKSIKDLADYLLYLDKNDTAYNEYFAWKSSYVPLSLDGRFIDYCTICESINSPKFNITSSRKLTEVYNLKSRCHERFASKKNELLRQIEESEKS
eukprot:gene69-666_t